MYRFFLVAVQAIEAGLLLGKGVLLIDQHEGDALHLLQIVLRMAGGEVPHVDFTTPVGALAFAPVAWLIGLGVGAGKAMMGGMLLVALFLLPAIWWVGYSRLSGPVAWLFGAFVIVLCTALVYGGGDQAASISMYYNRWAWAVALLLLVVAVVPSARRNPGADGVLLGLGLVFLALSKITFFVAFLPGILLALILRRAIATTLIGLVAAAVAVLLVTLILGLGFWAAYVNDLATISRAGIRGFPGQTLPYLLVGPAFLAANLCLLAGIVLLRQSGRAAEGLLLLIFAPAFVYVTYQNWGNDPKWLIGLAVLLMALRPDRAMNNTFGWDIRRSMGVVALVSLVLILPSVVNLSLANLRHARMSASGYFQVLPGAQNADLAMQAKRMLAPSRRTAFNLADPAMRAMADAAVTWQDDVLFGQPLATCKLESGLVGVLIQMARDLDALPGTSGRSVLMADTFSNLWMFGATIPLPGGAPWYYGGEAGLERADFILVPTCPATPMARTGILTALAERRDLTLSEVMRNDLFILLRRGPD
ncbi:MAG: hypothetical protein KDK00_12680 [Rhodobacteraceae bacterium]|nr:hypothetical protein [Paracoccaceae bacterium]